ncbi:MAG: toxin-antitoxin system HicB family antitoxin [Rhodoferax sp.]|nr:toxin-antitoxin system HicB family antitoxin [Rhodoferax sp.]
MHEKLAIAAQAQGKSINTLAQEALRECVAS